MSPASNEKPPAGTPAATTAEVLLNDTAAEAASLGASRLPLAALMVLVVAYAALSHYSASTPDAEGVGAALSVGPVFLIGLFLAWRWIRPPMGLLIAVILCACLYRYWPVVKKNYEWADLVQQCGAYALVAVSFARSLGGGRVPLCTQLAEKLHGTLTPAEISYTRRATVAWGVFYVLVAMAILLLFFATPLGVWSFFVNFVTFGLILLMGVADHLLRRRLLPRHPGGGILTIIQRALIG